uniref:Uncharacterized protein n=1 Tax=Rhizophora mucronata TaxID=61149 RepID=A0A2P2PLZ0_RHIMU
MLEMMCLKQQLNEGVKICFVNINYSGLAQLSQVHDVGQGTKTEIRQENHTRIHLNNRK